MKAQRISGILLVCVSMIVIYLVLLFSLTGPDLTDRFFYSEYYKFRSNSFPGKSRPVYRVFFIGDTGDPDNLKEPVLAALSSELREWGDSAFVIFLGDNIYPSGLPDSSHENRSLYERKILLQISTVINNNAAGVFIPGNHDWNNGAGDGLLRVRQQKNFINSFNDHSVRYLTTPGCPKPEFLKIDSNLSFIFLDTQALIKLSGGNNPYTVNCSINSLENFGQILDSMLTSSEENLRIIAGHHPVESHGPHGGYFNWKNHLFPLLELRSYLWIPLPLIGSLYPVARISGISDQDLSSKGYANFIKELKKILLKHNNVIYVSGHEHSLQVLKVNSKVLQLISGSGIYHHQNPVTKTENTIFAGAIPGYMSITFYEDNSAVLEVVEVKDQTGSYSSVVTINLNELLRELN